MIALLLLLFAAGPTVTVDIYPRVIPAGGEARLSCRVPRREEHRWVALGIEHETRSERQLDGSAAPALHLLSVRVVGCEAGAAFCEVFDSTRRLARAETAFIVAGCEG